MSQTEISKLSDAQQQQNECKKKYECQICFKKVNKKIKDYYKMKSCEHRFHKECLINYIQRVEYDQNYNCCPQCKTPYKADRILKSNKQNSNQTEQLISHQVGCVICYSAYTQESPPISIPCNHFYHEKCITEWMNNCNTSIAPCPLCRKNFEIKDIKIRFDVFSKLQKEENQSISFSSTSSSTILNSSQINISNIIECSDSANLSIISSTSSEQQLSSIINQFSLGNNKSSYSHNLVSNVSDKIQNDQTQFSNLVNQRENNEDKLINQNEKQSLSDDDQSLIFEDQLDNSQKQFEQEEELTIVLKKVENNQEPNINIPHSSDINQNKQDQITNSQGIVNNNFKIQNTTNENKINLKIKNKPNKVGDKFMNKQLIDNLNQQICVDKDINKSEQFQIFVQDISGRTFLINITKNTLVKDFANYVSKYTNTSVNQLRFSSSGKGFSIQNNGDELLTKFQVKKHSTIHLLLSLKGGYNQQSNC